VPKPDVLEQSQLNMLQAAAPAWSGVSLRKCFTVSDDEIIGKSVNMRRSHEGCSRYACRLRPGNILVVDQRR
jgi:hypothetical protein